MRLDFNILSFLFFSLAVIFIFEGILYAVFPSTMKKIMESFLNYNIDRIRLLGLSFLLFGLVLLYLLVKFMFIYL